MSIGVGVIRGVCQMPTYIAYEKGFFKEQNLNISLTVEPTAWMLPNKLISGEISFAVMPWTRVVSGRANGDPMVVIAGSGYEEPVTVVRNDANVNDFYELKGKRIGLPNEGGMKDLTSQAFFKKYNITSRNTKILRFPSGDAAILALISGAVDSTTNVEPYATMMVKLGVAKILVRGKDIFPKTPGCSITVTDDYLRNHSDLALKFINACIKAEKFCSTNPDEAAEISSNYIGISAETIREALNYNRPHIDISESVKAMTQVTNLMVELGYIKKVPEDFYNFTLLKKALSLRK